MEVNRLELHELLSSIMESEGESPNLYFQPPETVKLAYPCIVYRLAYMTSDYADDDPYRIRITYDITYITRSPTSKVPTDLARSHEFAFDRYYISDNLHHYVYRYTSTLKEEAND